MSSISSESYAQVSAKPKQDNSAKPSILSQASRFLQHLLFEEFESSPVRIWQSRDRLGHIYWHVYDRPSNRSLTFSSAETLRIWLERRYYE